MSEPANFYALLIGIKDYQSPSIQNLSGCIKDVELMSDLLQRKFHLEPNNIKTLTNEQATHENIKTAFREHLIAQAKNWCNTGKTEPAPAFLFHYSGHGSQALDPTHTKPDGMDETIVPYDSRTEGVFDIKDWEIGALLDELTDCGVENVTVIMDCCHSGSGTRGTDRPTIVKTRRCPPDTRPQPQGNPNPRKITRSIGAKQWLTQEKYVLFAACRNIEEANEHHVPEGDSWTTYGALTYFLVNELNRLSRQLTYHGLYKRVRHQVNSIYPEQNPQCEGDREREIFGNLRPASDMMFDVIDKSDGYIWINGGLAHNITEGSELKVYPAETRTLQETDDAIATLIVEEEGAVRSGCVVKEEGSNVPLHSRVVVYRINFGNMRRSLLLEIDNTVMRDNLRTWLSQKELEPYIHLVEQGQADYRITLRNSALNVQNNSGQNLLPPYTDTRITKPGMRGGSNTGFQLTQDLPHLVRFQNTLGLTNRADYSELADALEINVKLLAFDSNTQEPIATPLEIDNSNEMVFDSGQRVVVEVTNHADQDLYFSILNLGNDLSITQLYPKMKGTHEQLQAGHTFSHGLSRKRVEQLTNQLPKDSAEGWDVIKVIATVDETDFTQLEQLALKKPFSNTRGGTQGKQSALSQLLEQAMSGGKTRAMGPPRAEAGDEWTTAHIRLHWIQEQVLQARRTVEMSGYKGFRIETPQGFQGKVRILTPRQTTHSGDANDLQPPPGLAKFPTLFQPLNIHPTRALDSGGAVIELEADNEARAQINVDNPLKLHLPTNMASDNNVLALAYDGSFFYPVGSGDSTTVAVEWLPESPPAAEQPLRSTRSVGRTLKLYLFKLMDLPEPSLGLHCAKFVPTKQIYKQAPQANEHSISVSGGEVRYRILNKAELKLGQRVVLCVHGFNSDTPWFVSDLSQLFQQHDIHYDHILAFDYESFNTAIGDNAKTLANALKNAGFHADDGIHLDIFAHSMGTLVTRGMVELEGGHAFVDRCFLAGPPNQGTVLAEAKRFVPWFGALLLQFGSLPSVILAYWVLKRVDSHAIGPEDLRPDSKFLQKLNDPNNPSQVPYFILAGRNDIPPAERGMWQHFMRQFAVGLDAGLDFLFGDQHDLVINVNSMMTVHGGQYPLAHLQSKLVPCNHFDYFVNDIAREQLVAWVKAKP